MFGPSLLYRLPFKDSLITNINDILLVLCEAKNSVELKCIKIAFLHSELALLRGDICILVAWINSNLKYQQLKYLKTLQLRLEGESPDPPYANCFPWQPSHTTIYIAANYKPMHCDKRERFYLLKRYTFQNMLGKDTIKKSSSFDY